jgi:hypothetical protein
MIWLSSIDVWTVFYEVVLFWVRTSASVIFIRIRIRLNTTWAIFIRTSTSGIFQKNFDIYPHRPEAFLDFRPIFIRTGLRDLVELSGVLQVCIDRLIFTISLYLSGAE